ncbi:MAG TPA: L-histidine N(alpha)-methyltransferase [Chryseosolibacter sp.]|nr:L-histidine N(alpha)-methyltransferase [Chryseosolibacter sp.]
MRTTKTIFDQSVAKAVAKGFDAPVKTLPSWLFYDQTGDQLFQQIMRMPEYYPTRCEYDILQKNKDDILRHFGAGGKPFHLIELGAGDGLKTEILLKHFLTHETDFTYFPVDISASALGQLSSRLKAEMPRLRLHPLNKTYDEALQNFRGHDQRKVILFMGANIGNFSVAEATQFLRKLALPLAANDMILVGFDLKKDPRVIQEAYDDPRGLTRSFNLNILTRLNRELGAHFDLQDFTHYPYYNPESGTTKSYLISMRDHSVYIEGLGRSIHFHLWEPVQTEISQKYDGRMIDKLVTLSGLAIEHVFYDSDKYFCDVLMKSADVH